MTQFEERRSFVNNFMSQKYAEARASGRTINKKQEIRLFKMAWRKAKREIK